MKRSTISTSLSLSTETRCHFGAVFLFAGGFCLSQLSDVATENEATRPAILERADFRVFAQIADENDFIDAACHGESPVQTLNGDSNLLRI